MNSLIEKAFHNHWLNVIKKLKGVKGVVPVKTATKPPQFFILVTVAVGKDKQKIKYKLDGEPTIQMDPEYLFIVNDLKQKGYG